MDVAKWADAPVNECVPAGTMISTPHGLVAVENIQSGMIVFGERGGEVVSTRVVATKQSVTNEPLVQIGDLSLTGNHPVWTTQGYIEARRIELGMIVSLLPDCPDSKSDLIMLQCGHEQTTVGNLQLVRSNKRRHPLHRYNISRQTQIQRASVASGEWRQNAPGLLDSLPRNAGVAARLSSNRTRAGARLARRGASLDRCLSRNVRSGESYGRWRRCSRIRTVARTAPKVVRNALRCTIRPWAHSGYARQAAYSRGAIQNIGGRDWSRAHERVQEETFFGAQGQNLVRRTQGKAKCFARGQNLVRRTQAKNSGCHNQQESCSVRRNRAGIRLQDRGSQILQRVKILDTPGHSQGLSMQRQSLSSSLGTPVYNFQTTSGNYFANRILVHNCDLHARHLWLLNQSDFRTAMRSDPDYCDPKIAGWWVWGLCCWIGSGWCDERNYNGEGRAREKRPHLGNAGMGVHRPSQQLPHLGNAGMGVHRPSQQLPHLGNAGCGVNRPSDIYDYFAHLQSRLRRVRVCCGDWQRVLGDSPTTKLGVTGVFLDPPYLQDLRDDLYATERNVSADVREWAIANGDNAMLRIALCGYSDSEYSEHDMPREWTKVLWKARGGYGSQGNGRGRENANRETIWFSPHCLPIVSQPNLFDFNPEYPSNSIDAECHV